MSSNNKSFNHAAAAVRIGAVGIVILIGVCYFRLSVCQAVNSKITRISSGAEVQKGKTEDVVISTKGQIKLGLSAETIADKFEDINEPWAVNCIVVSGPTVYFGTSPNGGIYQYSLGKITKIYPSEEKQESKSGGGLSNPLAGLFQKKTTDDSNDVETEEKSETVKEGNYLTNEHIFAMATDVSGQLLAAISGSQCRLIRLKAGAFETVFEPNDTKYIFAITTDNKGNIYLGTGPKGKIFTLDSFGRNPEVIYEARDKNILSLAADDKGFIYAGGDERGLIYKIDAKKKSATVLYDSDQEEITAMLAAGDGNLYAAGAIAKVVSTQERYAATQPPAGRPEITSEPDESTGNTRSLQIANTRSQAEEKKTPIPTPSARGTRGQAASYIYKISDAGYVTKQFTEAAVFLCLAQQDKKILVGSGNDAQLFAIEEATEQQAAIYEDKQASQITALAVTDKEIYAGTANPAKLIRLKNIFAEQGNYISDLIDAGQPARWGKLQIEADVPADSKVLVAARSGNVKDVNDPTFCAWSSPVEITGPVQLDCPVGRFCQYKLILKSSDGINSPVIREVAIASSIPNLAPTVESVSVNRIQASGKEGTFKIDYKAKDENDDKLIYKIDFRKMGRENLIEIKDQVDSSSFEWDSKTVEDGRYEIRVTASDERSNTAETKLTDTRISDPVIVDNTAPQIEESDIKVSGDKITLKLTVIDRLTVIGQLQYTVDSNADWTGTLPDDLIYDTTKEEFTIIIEKQKPGEHVVAIKISDDVGNTAYQTFEATVGGN